MPELTKHDLEKAINAQTEHFDQKFEGFATMVANGFESVDNRFDKLEARIAKLEDKIDALSAKLTAHLDLSDKRYLELKRRDMVIGKWLKQIADKTGVDIDLKELEKF